MQINLTPDYSLPVIMLIFLANYLVVRKFFLKPVNEILEARATEIHTADRTYEDALARFNKAAEEMELRLHTAKREGSVIREKRRGEAAARRAEMIDRTRREAETITGDAGAELTSLVDAARKQIAVDSERLAREAAERMIGRRLA